MVRGGPVSGGGVQIHLIVYQFNYMVILAYLKKSILQPGLVFNGFRWNGQSKPCRTVHSETERFALFVCEYLSIY